MLVFGICVSRVCNLSVVWEGVSQVSCTETRCSLWVAVLLIEFWKSRAFGRQAKACVEAKELREWTGERFGYIGSWHLYVAVEMSGFIVVERYSESLSFLSLCYILYRWEITCLKFTWDSVLCYLNVGRWVVSKETDWTFVREHRKNKNPNTDTVFEEKFQADTQ